jgi:hypothetical protein
MLGSFFMGMDYWAGREILRQENFMLYWAPLCIVQKPTLRSHFSTKGAISTTGFGDIIRRDIGTDLWIFAFFERKTISSFQGTKELLKVFHLISYSKSHTRIFQFDGSLRLWEGLLHVQQLNHQNFDLKFMRYLLARTQHLTPPSSQLMLIT